MAHGNLAGRPTACRLVLAAVFLALPPIEGLHWAVADHLGTSLREPWLRRVAPGLNTSAALLSLGKPVAEGPPGGAVADHALSSNTTLDNATLGGSKAGEAKGRGNSLSYVRFNGEGDIESLKKSLAVSSALAFSFLALFSLLRRLAPEAYTRLPGAEEGLENWRAKDVGSLLDWLRWVWQTTPDEEVEAAGLDGWAVLAFYRLSCQLFSFLGVFLLAVLVPLHRANTPATLDPLSRLDIGNLPVGSPVFWVHAFLVWFVVLACNSMVLQAHREFLQRRFDWLKAIPEPRASTLMVENIPERFRSDSALKEYFVDVFKEEAIESAYVVRKTQKLHKRLQWLTIVKYQLLIEESRWEQSGGRPEDRKAVDRCEQMREEALKAVAEELAAVDKAVEAQDSQVVSPAGFVTFTSEFWQRLASKEQYRADVEEFAVSMPPDPDDVQWQDLAQGHIHSSISDLLGWTCLVLIFLFWSPVVAFISTLTTLETLSRMVPAIEPIAEAHPMLRTLIEGFLATSALKLFLSFLPNMLMVVIRRFFTLKAGTLAQLRLQRWYYSFLFIFVLLVTIIGRSALITASEIANNPGSVITRLAGALPSASHFYIGYVVLGWFTVSFESTRLVNVARYAYLRFTHGLEPAAAKEHSEPEDEDCYGVGARMGMAVLMFSITVVFCTCTPLVLAFAAVYFLLGRTIYGYLLVHAESRKPDLGGHVFFESLRQILFVLVVFVLLMSGVLLKHSGAQDIQFSWRSPPGPPVVAGLALLAVIWTWRRLHSLAWDALPLEEVVRASRAREAAAKEGATRRRCGRYVQRECDLELLLEDAEKVASARARAEGGSIVYAVHDYVRSAADLVDFGKQVTSRGTDLATAVVDRGLGAVDQTLQGFVHYGTTGATAVVDGGSEAASLFSRTINSARTWTQGRAWGSQRSSSFRG